MLFIINVLYILRGDRMINKIFGYSNVQQQLRRTVMIGLLGAASMSAGAIVPPAVTASNAASAATSASNSIRMSKNRHKGRTMHFRRPRQRGNIIIIGHTSPQQHMRINGQHQMQQSKTQKDYLETKTNNNKHISMWNKISTGLKVLTGALVAGIVYWLLKD